MKTLLLFILLSIFPVQLFAQTVPHRLTHQGRLLSISGIPMEGSHQMTFSFYNSEVDGELLWGEEFEVSLRNGFYNVILGTNPNNSFSDSLFDSIPLYLGIQVGTGEELSPRQELSSTPFALRSEYADSAYNVDGGKVVASEVFIGETEVINTNGEWVGPSIMPPNMVIFFWGAACPTGFTELVEAQGRYLVGLPSGGDPNQAVGIALTDKEDRTTGKHTHVITDDGHDHTVTDDGHTHTVTDRYGYDSKDVRNDDRDTAVFSATYTVSRTTSPETTGISINNAKTNISLENAGTIEGTNAPYLQLLVCKKN